MNIPDWVKHLDQNDQLASLKEAFLLPNNIIYLDGNSLGPVCKSAQNALQRAQMQWQEDLIGSWNQHNWIDLPSQVGEKIATLIGAAPGQTICCDSISINLFKIIAAALAMQPGRRVVVSERDNFPTDLYMVEGLQQLLGENAVELKLCSAEQLPDALDSSVALLMLTEVNFRSGAKHDMAAINQAAHAHGILCLWDLAHSAGAFPVHLDSARTDFAVGCGYKYLNGGPGSPAFVYVAERHQKTLRQPLCGWMGHANPFAFDAHYEKADSINSMLAGTPPILSMACLSGSLDLFSSLQMSQLEQKAKRLMDTFLTALGDTELELITPITGAHGNQLSFTHADAYAICQCLIEQAVIADFRAPNILRLGFSASFLSHSDVYQAATRLREIVHEQHHAASRFQIRQKVT